MKCKLRPSRALNVAETAMRAPGLPERPKGISLSTIAKAVPG